MAPIEIIGSTIANVTMQRFGELKENNNEIKIFYLKVIFFSLFISSLSGLLIWLTSGYFIPLLGDKWRESTNMVIALVPFFISYLFNMPTTNFLRFINKSKFQLTFELVELAFKIGLLSFFPFDSAYSMVKAFGIASCVFSFLKTAIVYKLIK